MRMAHKVTRKFLTMLREEGVTSFEQRPDGSFRLDLTAGVAVSRRSAGPATATAPAGANQEPEEETPEQFLSRQYRQPDGTEPQ